MSDNTKKTIHERLQVKVDGIAKTLIDRATEAGLLRGVNAHSINDYYELRYWESRVGGAWYLGEADGPVLESHGYYLHGDFHACMGDPASRQALTDCLNANLPALLEEQIREADTQALAALGDAE